MGGPADDKPRVFTGARAGTPLPPRASESRPPTALDASAKSKPEPKAGPKTLIGSTISDRYLIERLLGEGGMGAVYQAEHTLMRKRMAIKVLHPEMTRLPEVVARFEREAMAAAHIDHPNVVTATDFGKLEDGSFFLALEFVEGASLREVIGQGRLELGRSLHIARQMAAALQRAHLLKIVHRDLKPENVMLVDRDGDPDFVKVLDFGIAKVQMGELGTNDRGREPRPEQNVLTQAGMVYGTPEYMAPEQALGQSVDARADLYALGVIMYEMLTGRRPFEADSKVALLGMQVTAPVPAMITKCADCNVPLEVEVLVAHLLAKEANERIADAKDVIEAITTVLNQFAGTGRIDPRYAPPPTSGGGRMTNPALISGIAPAPPELAAAVGKASPAAGDGLLAGRAWILIMGAGILGFIVLATAVVYVFRSHDSNGENGLGADAAAIVTSVDGAVATVPDAPTDERVKEAIGMIDRGDFGSGIKKLEDLGDAVSGREDVHRALLTAYSQTDRPKEAMREAGLVLKSNPSLDLKEEVKLRVEVRNTALREGTTDAALKSAVDDAFSLFETQMGTQGWEDLYDLGYQAATAQAYPKASKRARGLLARGDRTKMGPTVAVDFDLQQANETCNATKLYDRAARDGDERALVLLKQLQGSHKWVQVGGGWRKTNIDQLGCLHEGDKLKTAIQQLEERLKATKRK